MYAVYQHRTTEAATAATSPRIRPSRTSVRTARHANGSTMSPSIHMMLRRFVKTHSEQP